MLFLADLVFNLHIHFLLQQICSIILEAKEEKGLSQRERDVASWHYIKLGRECIFFLLSNARLTSRLPPISPVPKSLTTDAAAVQGRRNVEGYSSLQISADQLTLFQPSPYRERVDYAHYITACTPDF